MVCAFLSLLLQLGQDLAFSEEVVGVLANLDFSAAVLREEDLVASGDGEGSDLAVFVGCAGAGCEHSSLRGLLLGLG